MAKEPHIPGKSFKEPRGRPTIAGMLKLKALAGRFKPALSEKRMVSMMEESLKEVRGLENREAFERIYGRGETEVKNAIFSKLKIQGNDATLLSVALGGVYKTPDKDALSKLVARYGAGKMKFWVSMFGRISGNELPRARALSSSLRFGAGADKAGKVTTNVRTEDVVTDMFVQPLVTYSLLAKTMLSRIDNLGQAQKKPR